MARGEQCVVVCVDGCGALSRWRLGEMRVLVCHLLLLLLLLLRPPGHEVVLGRGVVVLLAAARG